MLSSEPAKEVEIEASTTIETIKNFCNIGVSPFVEEKVGLKGALVAQHWRHTAKNGSCQYRTRYHRPVEQKCPRMAGSIERPWAKARTIVAKDDNPEDLAIIATDEGEFTEQNLWGCRFPATICV